jgi:shikimate dehydrogenase
MSLLPALTGSFSTPAAGNPTVAIMEAAYHHHDIDARYLNCDVTAEHLGDAVRGATAMGWIGFNCSLPHKVAVIELLDELADSARLIGAVNCAIRSNDRWIGANTDGQGFLTSLRSVAEPAGQRALILGAGGAARAIAVELALAGASEIWVANRNVSKASDIANLVNSATSSACSAIEWQADLWWCATSFPIRLTPLSCGGRGRLVLRPSTAAACCSIRLLSTSSSGQMSIQIVR